MIIYLKSFLDNDFYKFIMQNAIIKLFPNVKVRYKFINRGNHFFPKNFDKILKLNLKYFKKLKISLEEIKFLKKISFLDYEFIDLIKNYEYDLNELKISQKNGNLKIIIEGFWYRTILWEVPLMFIISELYYKLNKFKRISNEKIIFLTKKKINLYKKLNIKFAEFGTRRRHSYEVHNLILNIIEKESKNLFIGSSNVHLSHKINKLPIGTCSHEWFMFHAVKYGLKIANFMALKNWLFLYYNQSGFALPDTYTTSFFLKNFNKNFSNIFIGVRHDSGDPINFIKKIIKHYEIMGINPNNKTIMFSDNLNPEKIYEITKYCNNKIKTLFGIGTNFTNDVGLKKMNIVIKMDKVLCDKIWTPTVKISDTIYKYSGDIKIINYFKKIINKTK